MKRTLLKLLSISSLVILLFPGCDKAKDLLDISFTSNSVDAYFTVNPSSAGAYSSTETIVSSDMSDQISSNGGNISSLKSIELETCTITVQSADRNLNPFQSLEVYINVPGVGEKKVAWVDNVPTNVTYVALSISSDDIKTLIDQDQYTVTVRGILDGALDPAIDLKATITYKVVVSPL
jgi:hypothetical protein